MQLVDNYKEIIKERLVYCEKFVEKEIIEEPLQLEEAYRIVEPTRVRLIDTLKLIQKNNILKNGSRVLEIGCGYGQWLFCLNDIYDKKLQLYSTEHPNRDVLKNKEFLKQIKDENITLKASDLLLEDLPFEDESMDLILFTEVIEHLSPVDVPRILKKISRKLNNEGSLVISSPNRFSLLNRLLYLAGKSPTEPCLTLDHTKGGFGHIKLYGQTELDIHLKSADLQIADFAFSNCHIYFFLNSGSKLKKIRNYCVSYAEHVLNIIGYPQFQECWICVAKKTGS